MSAECRLASESERKQECLPFQKPFCFSFSGSLLFHSTFFIFFYFLLFYSFSFSFFSFFISFQSSL